MTGHGLDRPVPGAAGRDRAAAALRRSRRASRCRGRSATAYRFMITLYKLNFNGGWELPKPRVPDFVIVPPLSDFTNLFQPPDFSGVDGDNPIEDVCDVFIALVAVDREGDRRGHRS